MIENGGYYFSTDTDLTLQLGLSPFVSIRLSTSSYYRRILRISYNPSTSEQGSAQSINVTIKARIGLT
jgi:hypothetical protein